MNLLRIVRTLSTPPASRPTDTPSTPTAAPPLRAALLAQGTSFSQLDLRAARVGREDAWSGPPPRRRQAAEQRCRSREHRPPRRSRPPTGRAAGTRGLIAVSPTYGDVCLHLRLHVCARDMYACMHAYTRVVVDVDVFVSACVVLFVDVFVDLSGYVSTEVSVHVIVEVVVVVDVYFVMTASLEMLSMTERKQLPERCSTVARHVFPKVSPGHPGDRRRQVQKSCREVAQQSSTRCPGAEIRPKLAELNLGRIGANLVQR